MGFFSDSKDRLVAGFALPMLNNGPLKPYGEATDLKLNTSDKTVEVTVALRGEQEPIRVEVQDYALSQDGGKTFVVLNRISTSRAWMTELAQQHLAGKRFEVPPQVASVLARFL
jgi:hypothetical protein